MYRIYKPCQGATIIKHADGTLYGTTDGVVVKYDAASGYKIDMDSMTVSFKPEEIDSIGDMTVDHSEGSRYDTTAILESLMKIFADAPASTTEDTPIAEDVTEQPAVAADGTANDKKQ